MLATLMVSFTAANLWWTFRNLPEEDAIASKAQLRQDEDVSTVYDGIAKDYDSNMAWSEFGMGMPLLRRFLAKRLQVGGAT